MGIIDNVKSWILDDPDDEKEKNDKDGEYQKDYQQEVNIADLDALILVCKPKVFNDALKISRQIKKSRAVMISLGDMNPDDKQRLIDFVSGVVMAQNGLVAKVYDNVYVAAAKNIGIINMNE